MRGAVWKSVTYSSLGSGTIPWTGTFTDESITRTRVPVRFGRKLPSPGSFIQFSPYSVHVCRKAFRRVMPPTDPQRMSGYQSQETYKMAFYRYISSRLKITVIWYHLTLSFPMMQPTAGWAGSLESGHRQIRTTPTTSDQMAVCMETSRGQSDDVRDGRHEFECSPN